MVSPRPIRMTAGIYAQERDISQYVRELTNCILALVGTASKGEMDKRVLVSSLTNGIELFGVPSATHPASLVMREYFNAGGGRLWRTRVGNGAAKATVTVDLIDSSDVDVDAPEEGSEYNNLTLKFSYGQQASTSKSATHTFSTGDGSYAHTATDNKPLVARTVVVKINGTKVATDNGSGALVFESTLTQSSAYSGTVNYQTGVVTIVTTGLSVAVTSATVLVTANYWSTFNIQVLQNIVNSDDEVVAGPYVVETFRSLTLTNMVERLATSIYYNPADAYDAFPLAGNYTFSGGTDGIEDIIDADYIGNVAGENPTGMQNYAFPDQCDINLLAVPKASERLAVRQAMIQLAEVSRSDTLVILDPPANISVQDVVDWADGNGDYSSYDTIDSTYAAIYYPNFSTYNNITAETEDTPPSAAAVAAFARSNPWEAPAGPERGKLLNIIDINRKLNPVDREFLEENRINPISDIMGIGTMVAGQHTATISSTSLDRIGARMMLMRIEKALVTALYPLLYKENIPSVWNQAQMIGQPYLDSLVRRERIYFGEFICNRATNTDDLINNNIMGCQVRIQPLKYAEIILVTFQIEKVGQASISEQLVSSLNNV